jgi:type VI secretion system protein ImpK
LIGFVPMPIAPSPRPVDDDTDPFATQVSNRRVAPRKSSVATEADAAASPNPLMSEADPLLSLVPQLRSTAQIADLAQLRVRIVELLHQFDAALRRRGVGSGPAQKAHLVLCVLIDEVVEAMPWGTGGRWERLNPWQAAAAGRPGAAAIQQFVQMAEDRAANRDLRELIYVALALGFDARGRGLSAGAGDPEQIRSRVAALLKREGDADAQPLSVRWRPAVGRANAFGSWLPLWVGTFVVAGLLAVLYFSLALALSSSSDRVFAQIASLRLPAPAAGKAAPVQQSRLVPLLSTDASQDLQVRDEVDRSVVTVRDDVLFEPATANLLRAGAEALRPVAAALQRTPGRVLVLGHTDSHSERSARYPSNWELSVERARAVHDALLLFGIPAARMRYDGRADTEPLTAAGANPAQVHSGRVEIILQAGR